MSSLTPLISEINYLYKETVKTSCYLSYIYLKKIKMYKKDFTPYALDFSCVEVNRKITYTII